MSCFAPLHSHTMLLSAASSYGTRYGHMGMGTHVHVHGGASFMSCFAPLHSHINAVPDSPTSAVGKGTIYPQHSTILPVKGKRTACEGHVYCL
jgi:hypothetical protein